MRDRFHIPDRFFCLAYLSCLCGFLIMQSDVRHIMMTFNTVTFSDVTTLNDGLCDVQLFTLNTIYLFRFLMLPGN